MKILLSVLFSIFATLILSSSQIPDLMLLRYYGPVYQVVEITYNNGIINNMEIMEFNPEGFLVQNNYSSNYLNQSLYDSYFYTHVYTYIYGKDGFKTRFLKDYYYQGTFTGVEEAVYDIMGNETNRILKKWNIEGDELIKTREYKFKYDKNDRIFEILEITYSQGEILRYYITNYQYMKNGNIIEKWESSEQDESFIRTYDDKWKLLHVKTVDKSGTILRDEEIIIKNGEYFNPDNWQIHKFDKYNNIVEYSSDQFMGEYSIKREIIYYDEKFIQNQSDWSELNQQYEEEYIKEY